MPHPRELPKRPSAETPLLRWRQRRSKPRGPTVISINLVPMIDVTFQLLIFFAICSTFGKPEGLLAARLPRTAGTGAIAVDLPISPIIVRLRAEGERCRIRLDHFTQAPASFGDLAVFLKDLQGNPGFDEHTPVVIMADESLAWDHVVGCWNAAVRAGCKNIAFGAGR